MSSPIVKMTNITYEYARGEKSVDNLSMHVNKGDIYGFLGPNGSGKTTTLSLLLGLLKLQHGEVDVFGQSLSTHRIDILKKLGALIESPSLYGHLTARENLEVYREIYRAPSQRVNEVLEIVGLSNTGSKYAKNFSLGMKQRLSLALALLPNPQLLILDEPTNGLDPSGIIELRELLRKLNREHGKTIIISSHILSEVEKIANRIGVIYKGKLVFEGSIEQLFRLQTRQSRLIIKTSDDDKALRLLMPAHAERVDDGISLPYADLQQIAWINQHLIDNDIDVYQLDPKTQDLEELFMNLTVVSQ